jgi:hypothetical protein
MKSNSLKEIYNKFEQLQEKSERAYFDYFKSISTLSVALIGLLIGLKASPIPNQAAKIAFMIAIIFIGLCILFSLATRFYEVTLYKQESEAHRRILEKFMTSPLSYNLEGEVLNKSWVHKFFGIATFSCLLLSIIALIFYVYFLEFYPSEIILK